MDGKTFTRKDENEKQSIVLIENEINLKQDTVTSLLIIMNTFYWYKAKTSKKLGITQQ